jgi:hypothetical protein
LDVSYHFRMSKQVLFYWLCDIPIQTFFGPQIRQKVLSNIFYNIINFVMNFYIYLSIYILSPHLKSIKRIGI